MCNNCLKNSQVYCPACQIFINTSQFACTALSHKWQDVFIVCQGSTEGSKCVKTKSCVTLKRVKMKWCVKIIKRVKMKWCVKIIKVCKNVLK